MIERMMNGSPSNQELIDMVEGFIATDEFGVPYSQYVSETPYVESEALAIGRQLEEYPDPNTVGFIRINGVEYPINGVDDSYNVLRGNSDLEALVQEWEEEVSLGSYREPTLDAFSQLRPGYKGGNIPNLYKSCEPCSRVNPKDVAKRRAKNKAARKNKRK